MNRTLLLFFSAILCVSFLLLPTFAAGRGEELSAQLRQCSSLSNESPANDVSARVAAAVESGACVRSYSPVNPQKLINESKRILRNAFLSGQTELKQTNSEFLQALQSQTLKNVVKTFATNTYLFRGDNANMICSKGESKQISAVDCLVQKMCEKTLASPNFHCPQGLEKEVRGYYQKVQSELRVSKVQPVDHQKAVNFLNDKIDQLNKKLNQITPPDMHCVKKDELTLKSGKLIYKDQPSPQAQQKMQEYENAYWKVAREVPGTFLYAHVLKEKTAQRSFEDVTETKACTNWVEDTAHFKMKNHEHVSLDHFYSAYAEMDAEIMDHGRTLVKMELERRATPSDNKLIQFQLDRLVKTNPTATAQVLLEKPYLVKSVCHAFSSLEEEEKSGKIKDQIWSWGSVVVGGAATIVSGGTAAPVVAVLAALDTGRSSLMAMDSHQEMKQVRGALITGSGDQDSVQDYENAKEKFQGDLIHTGVSGAFTAFEINGLVKLGRTFSGSVKAPLNSIENKIEKEVAVTDSATEPLPVAKRKQTFVSSRKTTPKADTTSELIQTAEPAVPSVETLADGTRVEVISGGGVNRSGKSLVEQNSNVSTNVVLKLTKDDETTIFKPFAGEYPVAAKNWFAGAREGALGHREVDMSEIAQDLKLGDRVAKAKFGELKHTSVPLSGKGAQIEYIPGQDLYQHLASHPNFSIKNNPTLLQEYYDIRGLDFILADSDGAGAHNMYVATKSDGPHLVRLDRGKAMNRLFSAFGHDRSEVRGVFQQYQRFIQNKYRTVTDTGGAFDHNDLKMLDIPPKISKRFYNELESKKDQYWIDFFAKKNSVYKEMHPHVKEPLYTESDVQGFLLRRDLLLNTYKHPVPGDSETVMSFLDIPRAKKSNGNYKRPISANKIPGE